MSTKPPPFGKIIEFGHNAVPSSHFPIYLKAIPPSSSFPAYFPFGYYTANFLGEKMKNIPDPEPPTRHGISSYHTAFQINLNRRNLNGLSSSGDVEDSQGKSRRDVLLRLLHEAMAILEEADGGDEHPSVPSQKRDPDRDNGPASSDFVE